MPCRFHGEAALPAVTSDPTLGGLVPCGACQEWLRKIVVVNPCFEVLTVDGPDMKQTFVQPLPPGPPSPATGDEGGAAGHTGQAGRG